MFLLVIRLLAVYLATAAGILYLANRFISPVPRSARLWLALGPFLLVGEALLTAGVHAPIDIAYLGAPLSAHAAEQGTSIVQTPLLSDVVWQEVPWHKAVRDAAKNARLPLWNRFVLAGEPLLAVQQPAVFHPATWISFLLPLAQAWTFDMALRYFLSLVCAWLYLRDLGCRNLAALLGAFGWAFCDYMVFFLGYPLTLAAAPFPLLLLGLRRLARDPGRSAAALTVVALLLILVSGHPETLLHAVAAAGIVFLFELVAVDGRRRRRALLLALAAGAITLGIGAVLLIPLAEALPHTIEQFFRTAVFARSKKSVAVAEALRRALPDLQPYAFGFAGHGRIPTGYHEPSTYAGALLWPFAAVGLFSRRREKWALLVIGLLGAAMGARFPGITDVVSRLPLFDIGINERMVFLAAFATAALAAIGADELVREGRRAAVAAAGICGLAVAALLQATGGARFTAIGLPDEFFRFRFLAMMIPLAAAVLLCALTPRRRLGLALAGCLVIFAVERRLEEGDVYPTYRSAAFYPPLAAFASIPRTAPWRTTAVGIHFIPNIATLYELEDVRGYEAMTFKPLWDTFALWCIPQPVWFNRIDDPTRPFLSFLNVRWVFAPPDYAPPAGWPVRYRGAEGMLLENPGALPRAFAPRAYATEADAGARLGILAGITDFRERGIVGDGPSRSWTVNGAATVAVSGYLPQEMRLRVRAEAPAVVGTSMTAWPGWKLSIDGEKAPLLSYNHAFLGFRVPAGDHDAVLRYAPDSFRAGAAVSVLSLALSAFLLRRRRLAPAAPR